MLVIGGKVVCGLFFYLFFLMKGRPSILFWLEITIYPLG